VVFSQEIPSQSLGFIDAHASTLEISVAGYDLTIHQSPGLLNSTRKEGTTGAGRCWLSSSSTVILPNACFVKPRKICKIHPFITPCIFPAEMLTCLKIYSTSLYLKAKTNLPSRMESHTPLLHLALFSRKLPLHLLPPQPILDSPRTRRRGLRHRSPIPRTQSSPLHRHRSRLRPQTAPPKHRRQHRHCVSQAEKGQENIES
jgi:hypothetical protein